MNQVQRSRASSTVLVVARMSDSKAQTPWPERPLVLLVDDDTSHSVSLSTALNAQGYQVTTVDTGRRGLDAAEALDPDLVILELELPDIDGLAVIRHLKIQRQSPIIVVSSDIAEHRIVAALDMGAVDYVTKPYGHEVLAARIRRSLREAAKLASYVEPQLIVCGDLRIDIAARRIFVGKDPVELQAKPFDLLTLLARNEGRIVTYPALKRALWGIDSETSGHNALRVAITRIRQKLGSGPRRPVIHTEVKLGYRLSAPR